MLKSELQHLLDDYLIHATKEKISDQRIPLVQEYIKKISSRHSLSDCEVSYKEFVAWIGQTKDAETQALFATNWFKTSMSWLVRYFFICFQTDTAYKQENESKSEAKSAANTTLSLLQKFKVKESEHHSNVLEVIQTKETRANELEIQKQRRRKNDPALNAAHRRVVHDLEIARRHFASSQLLRIETHLTADDQLHFKMTNHFFYQHQRQFWRDKLSQLIPEEVIAGVVDKYQLVRLPQLHDCLQNLPSLHMIHIQCGESQHAIMRVSCLSGHAQAIQNAFDALKPRAYNKWVHNAMLLATISGSLNALKLTHVLTQSLQARQEIDRFTKKPIRVLQMPYPEDTHGLNPLHYAIMNNHTHLIPYCVNTLKIDPKRRTATGSSIIDIAYIHSSMETIDHLQKLFGLPFELITAFNTMMHYNSIDTVRSFYKRHPQLADMSNEITLFNAVNSRDLNKIRFAIDTLKLDIEKWQADKPLLLMLLRTSNLEIVKYAVEDLGLSISDLAKSHQVILECFVLNNIALLRYVCEQLPDEKLQVDDKEIIDVLHIPQKAYKAEIQRQLQAVNRELRNIIESRQELKHRKLGM